MTFKSLQATSPSLSVRVVQDTSLNNFGIHKGPSVKGGVIWTSEAGVSIREWRCKTVPPAAFHRVGGRIGGNSMEGVKDV